MSKPIKSYLTKEERQQLTKLGKERKSIKSRLHAIQAEARELIGFETPKQDYPEDDKEFEQAELDSDGKSEKVFLTYGESVRARWYVEDLCKRIKDVSEGTMIDASKILSDTLSEE